MASGGFVSLELKFPAMDETEFVVGQLAGPGSYRCESCGAQREETALSFEIEPCPCGGERFRRVD